MHRMSCDDRSNRSNKSSDIIGRILLAAPYLARDTPIIIFACDIQSQLLTISRISFCLASHLRVTVIAQAASGPASIIDFLTLHCVETLSDVSSIARRREAPFHKHLTLFSCVHMERS